MKLLKNKNGEITTQQIVMLIILITSFVVILFFFFRLNLGEVSNKEICHNSVVLKGKSITGFGKLDCKTNYLCISGGEKCEGINPTQTIKVDSDNKNETMKAIADEMVDCWWQFGEGKVDYEGEDWEGYHCAVCSSVKFDEKLKENKISYKDLFEYLEKTKKSESQTYLQYLFGVLKSEEFTDENKYIIENYNNPFSFDERYSIITGLNPNWPSSDAIIPVSFMKTSDLTKDITSCDVFDITKA